MIKWGSTIVSAVKWGNTNCTAVYWGSTKVFPDGNMLDIGLFNYQIRATPSRAYTGASQTDPPYISTSIDYYDYGSTLFPSISGFNITNIGGSFYRGNQGGSYTNGRCCGFIVYYISKNKVNLGLYTKLNLTISYSITCDSSAVVYPGIGFLVKNWNTYPTYDPQYGAQWVGHPGFISEYTSDSTKFGTNFYSYGICRESYFDSTSEYVYDLSTSTSVSTTTKNLELNISSLSGSYYVGLVFSLGWSNTSYTIYAYNNNKFNCKITNFKFT